MSKNSYSDKWGSVPVPVKRFILRALMILVAWKLLYLVILLPARTLDKPLSYTVGAGTTWVLNTFSHSAGFSEKGQMGMISTDNGPSAAPLENIYFHDWNVVSIEDSCNGLELMVLYIGFIICMPAILKRKLIFGIVGPLLIYVVNVLRCAGVAYIIIYYPRFADFAHHYVFTFVVYGVIIIMWLIFSRKLNLEHA